MDMLDPSLYSLDPSLSDVSDPGLPEDELDMLRKRYQQRFLAQSLQDSQNPNADLGLSLAGGGIDLLSRASNSRLNPVETITGLKLAPGMQTNAQQMIQQAAASRASQARQKALDDFSMMKNLEDIKTKRMAVASSEEDKKVGRDLQRQNLENNFALRGMSIGLQGQKLEEYVKNNVRAHEIAQERLTQGDKQFNTRIETQKAEGAANRQNQKDIAGMKVTAAKEKAAAQPKEFQYKAAGYGKRMDQADQVFNELSSAGKNFTDFGSMIQRGLPEALSGLKNPDLMRQEQAEREFINALLRRESGAAIAQSEFGSYGKQYFPRQGDTPDVLAQKAANRKQAIEAIRAEAGPAWGQSMSVPSPKGILIDKNAALAELKRRGRIK